MEAVALGLVLCVLAACASPADSLASTLPTSIGDVNLDPPRVIDESTHLAHPIDDVLVTLGKQRRDSTVVFRDAVDGSISVGAVKVDDVGGPALLSATVEAWLSPAVRERSQKVILGRDVWLIDIRPRHFVVAYASGDVVYIASSDDLSLIGLALHAMP